MLLTRHLINLRQVVLALDRGHDGQIGLIIILLRLLLLRVGGKGIDVMGILGFLEPLLDGLPLPVCVGLVIQENLPQLLVSLYVLDFGRGPLLYLLGWEAAAAAAAAAAARPDDLLLEKGHGRFYLLPLFQEEP